MPWMVPSSPKRPCSALNDDVGLEPRERLGDVALHVDARDPITLGLERIRASVARIEAHRPLDRPASHEHRDMPTHHPSRLRSSESLSDRLDDSII